MARHCGMHLIPRPLPRVQGRGDDGVLSSSLNSVQGQLLARNFHSRWINPLLRSTSSAVFPRNVCITPANSVIVVIEANLFTFCLVTLRSQIRFFFATFPFLDIYAVVASHCPLGSTFTYITIKE
jgi:hypothetical protein